MNSPWSEPTLPLYKCLRREARSHARAGDFPPDHFTPSLFQVQIMSNRTSVCHAIVGNLRAARG